MFRMSSWVIACLLSFNAIVYPQTAVAKTITVVHAGTLLAVPGEAPKSQQTIVMTDNMITRVLHGYVDPSDIDSKAELIDLSDMFVLPGLMDMHVHLLMELGPNTRTDVLTTTASLAAMRGVQFARRTLMAGFTTVRDLGGDPEAIYALREAIKRGYVSGPRIFAAGSSIAATGGHGDVNGVTPELMKLWTPATICDGPYDCRRATRYAVKHGADWIKITATGGVLSDSATGLELQMTMDELEEIVATAHGLGRRVAAHAHGTTGINAALSAGVDSIDHGTFLDDESLRLFKRMGAYLVPTMLPGHLVKNSMKGNPFFTPAIREKVRKASGASKASVKLAYDAGVKIAFGTDAGIIKHGANAEEFALMVDAGMSEMDAIRTATVVAAELLERSDELGTIEPGKLADLIAVFGDPLEKITVLEDVQVVIKNGKLIR